MEQVFRWLDDGIFRVEGGRVFNKHGKELTQRTNTRRAMDDGDARVDLFHDGLRRSVHVSQLVWMWGTGAVIPEGFEIHHRDEDPHNNDYENLICVHRRDHPKLHRSKNEPEEEVPF